MTRDAIVVGSGPNGLAAAITLAQAGWSVLVLEANEQIGGGARSGPLTEPGFVHDLASAIHPLGRASPFLSSLGLERFGLEWVVPPAAVGHPLDGGRAAIAWNDLDRTAAELGADGSAYRRTYAPLVRDFDELVDFVLRPVLRVPRHPLVAARFGLGAVRPAAGFVRRFATTEAQALFLGHATHAILPLTHPLTASFGLLFGASAHAVGWPFPRGGAQAISDAMAALLRELGGEIRTGERVTSLEDLPEATAVVLALTARQVAAIAGPRFPVRYREALASFPCGAAAFKVDYALREPIPWANADLRNAGTVHVCGGPEDILAGEDAIAAGRPAERPFVLVAQHTLFDPTRAPAGAHTAWAYCHVPNGSTYDATAAIEAQLERFAPGFRDVVLARRVTTPAELEAGNANLVGGDIGGGSYAGLRTVLRPRPQLDPYRTPDPRIFIGSSSAVPGAGVHGMAGHNAACSVLRRLGGTRDA